MQLGLPHVDLGPARLLRDTLDIREARSLIIHDSWVGYNDRSPICRVYEFKRHPDDRFVGSATFSSRFGAHPSLAVELAADEAESLLAVLGSASLSVEPYQPYFVRSDDYPRIEIVLHVAPSGVSRGGIVQLYTASQGEDHTPWCAFVEGACYSIAGDEIGHALRQLDIPLRRAEGHRLVSEADGSTSFG